MEIVPGVSTSFKLWHSLLSPVGRACSLIQLYLEMFEEIIIFEDILNEISSLSHSAIKSSWLLHKVLMF